MTHEEVLKGISEILSDILDRDVELNDSDTPDSVDGWDSLARMTMMLIIENTYAIQFTMDEISGFGTAGKLADIILEKKG